MDEKDIGLLINVDYYFNESENFGAIRLLIKGENGFFYVFDPEFKPYFYVDTKTDIPTGKFDEITILKVEKVRKILNLEEKELKRVYCKFPQDVAILSKLFVKSGIGAVYENRIPFFRRYLIDKNLKLIDYVEIETENIIWNVDDKKIGRKIVKKIKTLKEAEEKDNERNGRKLIGKSVSEALKTFRKMTFDIEVYNPSGVPVAKKDPIILIGYKINDKYYILSSRSVDDNIKSIEGINLIIVENEKELIQKFKETIEKENIEILSGYNSSGFDIPYLIERAHQNGIDFGIGLDGSEPIVKKTGMVTRAKIAGRINFDTFHSIKFLSLVQSLKSQRHTLEAVYKEMIGKEKEDIEGDLIWEYWDDKEKRKELIEYTKSDVLAADELFDYVLPLFVELSRMTHTPLSDVSSSSLGQLVESLLIDSACKDGRIVSRKPNEYEIIERGNEPIVGAYVKMPNPGIYDNLAVFDFRGLYPSIIISRNIDPSTLLDQNYEGECHQSPLGHKFSKKEIGLIPSTLNRLVETRRKIKSKLRELENAKHADSNEYNILNARSQALKYLSNSFYGYLRYPRSRWYSREAAESVTAWGRYYIKDVAKKAEGNGFDVLYQDSITKDRFVTILDLDGMIKIKNIEELFEENKKGRFMRGEKEVIKLKGYKSLSLDLRSGKAVWSPINEIIRHKNKKKIFRVGQKFGETIVTEDHSLISKINGIYKQVKPEEMKEYGMTKIPYIPKVKQIKYLDLYRILKKYDFKVWYKGKIKNATVKCDNDFVWFGWTRRKNPIKLRRVIKVGTREFEALCRLLGAYIAEGSSSTPETTTSRVGASIASSDTRWLSRLQADYYSLFKGTKTSVIPSMKNKRVLTYATSFDKQKTIYYIDSTYKLQMMNQLSAVFFKVLCGQKSDSKKLPNFIFHVPLKYQNILFNEMLKGDGSRKVNKNLAYSKNYKEKNFRYTTRSMRLMNGISLLLAQWRQNASISFRPSKKVYNLYTSDKYNSVIKTRLSLVNYKGYVYDLNVEGTNTFVDSCGQIVLHNTDSIFLLMGGKEEKDALQFMNEINKDLPESMELELEDFYKRGIFVTKRTGEKGAKKKYALINKEGKIKIRGFELVRRDWSKIAKETQRKVLDIILKEGDKNKAVNNAVKIVKDTVDRIKNGLVKKEDLIIYTQLKKKEYKITSPEFSAAEKARKRGKKIDVGSMISYIITKKGKSISEKAELAEFVEEGDYDPNYYINNQIIPPVIKIIGELGYNKEDMKYSGKQDSLNDWF